MRPKPITPARCKTRIKHWQFKKTLNIGKMNKTTKMCCQIKHGLTENCKGCARSRCVLNTGQLCAFHKLTSVKMQYFYGTSKSIKHNGIQMEVEQVSKTSFRLVLCNTELRKCVPFDKISLLLCSHSWQDVKVRRKKCFKSIFI